MFRTTSIPLAAAAVMLATDATIATAQVRDGVIVTVAAGKLVVANGVREQNYDVGLTAKITLDGKRARLAQLKTGDLVRVAQDNEGKVITVAAIREPPRNSPAETSLESRRATWYPTDHIGRTTGMPGHP